MSQLTPEEEIVLHNHILDRINESHADVEGLLEPHQWETKHVGDSEWHTAPPVEPLVELVPQQGLSVLPTWDGPLRPAPRTAFDDMYDVEMVEDYVIRMPSYQLLTGRFLPFETERLRDLVEGNSYSTFLKRPVITFKDALDHSIMMALFWSEEDADIAASKQVEPEWVPPPEDDVPKENAKEIARLAWKAAIQERKDALVILDRKVLEARMQYDHEKSKR